MTAAAVCEIEREGADINKLRELPTKSHLSLSWLLSKDGMETYIRQHSQNSLTPSTFKRNFSSILKQQQTVTILKNGRISGVFYPTK